MTPTLYIDLETESALDLREVGAARYAEEGKVLVGAVAVDTRKPELIHTDDDLLGILHGVGTEFGLVAHNAFFDLTFIRECWPKSWLWVGTHARVRDTMVVARSLNLPGGLDPLHAALFPCLPRKSAEGHAAVRGGLDLLSDPKVLEDRVRSDVEMTRRVWRELEPKACPLDLATAAVDVRVNMRGFGVDAQGCLRKAGEINAERGDLDSWARQEQFTQPLRRQDGGHLLGSKVKVKQHAWWLNQQGGRERARAAGLLDRAKRDWQLSAAESKWRAGDRFAGSDGRSRGMLHARVAQSGRWVSKDLQIHNMKRATADPLLDTRAMVQAEPGKVLVAADYSQMELRLALWACGAKAELAALAEGRDLYSEMAEKALGHEPSAGERHAAKTMLLAILYGQGEAKTLELLAGQGAEESVSRRLWDEMDQGVRQRLRGSWKRLTARLREATGTFREGDSDRPAVFERATWMSLPIWGRPLLWHGVQWGMKDGGEHSDTSYETWKGQWVRERIWGGVFFSHVIQGLASDILAAALVKAEDALAGTESRVVLHCHDEIVVECEEDHAERVAADLSQWMVQAAKGVVPMAVSTGIGRRWRDCK